MTTLSLFIVVYICSEFQKQCVAIIGRLIRNLNRFTALFITFTYYDCFKFRRPQCSDFTFASAEWAACLISFKFITCYIDHAGWDQNNVYDVLYVVIYDFKGKEKLTWFCQVLWESANVRGLNSRIVSGVESGVIFEFEQDASDYHYALGPRGSLYFSL
jgi:hypothetical protein